MGSARSACLGEASHGTREYYRWRAELSRRLIEERGFTWIGVEGDWPECWRTKPRRESTNYVPTEMGGRYDALVWFEQTTALHPLHHEAPPQEPELETEPSGF